MLRSPERWHRKTYYRCYMPIPPFLLQYMYFFWYLFAHYISYISITCYTSLVMLSAKNLRKFELKIMTISFIVMKLKKWLTCPLRYRYYNCSWNIPVIEMPCLVAISLSLQSLLAWNIHLQTSDFVNSNLIGWRGKCQRINTYFVFRFAT